MALITGTALVAIVWQGAVRIVGSKLAKELVKAGAKEKEKFTRKGKSNIEAAKSKKTLREKFTPPKIPPSVTQVFTREFFYLHI